MSDAASPDRIVFSGHTDSPVWHAYGWQNTRLMFWYSATEAGSRWSEGNRDQFDIRELPEPYIAGLDVAGRRKKTMRGCGLIQQHLSALHRAIVDGFDFTTHAHAMRAAEIVRAANRGAANV